MKLILVILILLAGSTRLEGANCDFNIEESYGNFHKSSLTQNYKNFKRECKKLYTIATGFKEEDGDDCLDGVRETKKFKTILNMLDCLCHLSRHQKQVYFNQRSFRCLLAVSESTVCQHLKEKPYEFCETREDNNLLQCLKAAIRTKCDVEDEEDYNELFQFIFQYSKDKSLCNENHLILGFLGLI